jgi:uncharacterized protein
MLRVTLREAHAGPVDTTGEVAPNDPAMAGLDVPLAAPIRVSGRFSSAGEDKFYWKVRFETTLRSECRRCLTEVLVPVEESRGLIFATDDETPEGDGCYLVSPRAQSIDLTEVLREEVALAVPRFVECRPDCKGLCPRCGKNLNDGPCDCPPQGDSRWDALKGLTTQATTPKKD